MGEPGGRPFPQVPLEPLHADDPQTMGEFRLLGRLGTGGMGVAYLADGGGSWAVVKIVRSDLADSHSFRARLARELEAMRMTAGPRTASVLTAELDVERPWFAMEFIPGATLAQRVAEGGPLPPVEIVALASGLADALADVHAAGVIHRDLKPRNVILSPTGPRLIDFGVAELAEGTRLTAVGTVVGTTGWLAPEQVTGDRVTPATDVHAWGLCVVYAASGVAPFGADTTGAAIYRVLEATPDVPATVPPPLHDLVVAALSKDPTHRPPVDRIRTTLAVTAASSPPPVPAAPASAPQPYWDGQAWTSGPPHPQPVQPPAPYPYPPQWPGAAPTAALEPDPRARTTMTLRSTIAGVLLALAVLAQVAAAVNVWRAMTEPGVWGDMSGAARGASLLFFLAVVLSAAGAGLAFTRWSTAALGAAAGALAASVASTLLYVVNDLQSDYTLGETIGYEVFGYWGSGEDGSEFSLSIIFSTPVMWLLVIAAIALLATVVRMRRRQRRAADPGRDRWSAVSP